MPGAPDPLYVAARRVLLDALDALREHLDALVLVGAQAVYIHSGEGDLAVDPYTSDGDLAIDPGRLGPTPLLEEALGRAGFERDPTAVGAWQASVEVEGVVRVVALDLLVPDALGGPGRRGARIPPHGALVARKAVGLEAAIVDHQRHRLRALDPSDTRQVEMAVAGPAALIVAKIHKIAERADKPDRQRDKDALDVYRLLRAVPTDELARRLVLLRRDRIAADVTANALNGLPKLFGSPRAVGCLMAVRAARAADDAETFGTSLVSLVDDLIAALESGK